MKAYRYRLSLKSPLGTPLRSDTLTGQLLWAAAMYEGDSAVTELIEQFENGTPPFIVSSGFPYNMLPMPVLPPQKRLKSIQEGNYNDMASAKQFKKMKWLSLDAWDQCRQNLNVNQLFEYWYKQPNAFSDKGFEPVIEPHNTIDRRSNTVLEGGLFFSESLVHESTNTFDIYVQTEDVERFEYYLDFVSKHGYGRDSSVGRGHFQYERDEKDVSWLFDSSGTHSLMLSVFSASNLDGVQGYYKPFVKRGRVWGGIGGDTPFKKPILAFEEGSIFSSLPSSGYVLRNIHVDNRVVQIMWPLGLACTIKEA